MNLKKANILVTICARGGSKGLPGKNIKPLLGKPLIAHTIEQALNWGKATHVVVSTDSEEIAEVARKHGALVPFMRPQILSTDASGKLPVITHALKECEKIFSTRFDLTLDLDPTSPLRRNEDIELGLETYFKNNVPVCFSVVKARKSPYFNMVERNNEGKIVLIKKSPMSVLSRQKSPAVWDMNASIYFYSRDFLLNDPVSLWNVESEIFEMNKESAFDIDEERDFIVTEALMKHFLKSEGTSNA